MIFLPSVDNVHHPGGGPLPGLQELLPGSDLQLCHRGPEHGGRLSVGWDRLGLPQPAQRDDDLGDSLGDVGLDDLLLGEAERRELWFVLSSLLVTGALIYKTNLNC